MLDPKALQRPPPTPTPRPYPQPSRLATAQVLPPSPHISNMPFGVFFAAGRHFNGFHVRFRDVARGGLRVTLTLTLTLTLALTLTLTLT